MEKFNRLSLSDLLEVFPDSEKVDDPFFKRLILIHEGEIKGWEPKYPRDFLVEAELQLRRLKVDRDEAQFKNQLLMMENQLQQRPEPTALHVAVQLAKAALMQNANLGEEHLVSKSRKDVTVREQELELAQSELDRWPAHQSLKAPLQSWLNQQSAGKLDDELFRSLEFRRWSHWCYWETSEQSEYLVVSRRGREEKNQKPKLLKSGCFVDEVEGEVYYMGKLIIEFSRKPILRQILIHLLENNAVASSKASFALSVWGEPYSPMVHDARIYTSVQRIRDLLEDRCIEVWEQGYRWNPKIDFRLVRPTKAEARIEDRIQSTILDSLRKRSKQANPWMKKSELAEGVNTTDSTLKRALAVLVNEGLVIREGAGPSVRYRKK